MHSDGTFKFEIFFISFASYSYSMKIENITLVKIFDYVNYGYGLSIITPKIVTVMATETLVFPEK